MTVNRGRPATLNAQQILAAAIQCADSEGIGGITMRAVANRLGVTPMALYRYVRDKGQLLDQIPDILMFEVAQATTRQGSGVLALSEIGFGLANTLAARPWATRLFEQPKLGPNMQLAAEHCVALLVAEGASPDEAFRWIRAVIAQVIGEMLTSHGPFDRSGIDLLLAAIGRASRA